ncbi:MULTISPECIES: hypothetical protein [Methylomonas]|nr:hypothetical protein [Methylomonas koyamae]
MEKHIITRRLIRRFFWLFCSVLYWGFVGQAQALPSFARQTGMACAMCHTQAFGPNLTPYGRQFKLNGYVWGNNDSAISRFGGMAVGSLTNTKRNDSDIPADPVLARRDFNSNNNLALDQASLFYGGKVYGNMGAFVQFTYDGVASRFALDNTDIRIADEADWLGRNFVYGVSFNNSPTVQDLWNTTPAWGFPYSGSPLARTPGAEPALAALGGQIGGATLYSMIDDTVFLEAGAYTSFAKYAQKGMGQWDDGAVKVDGGAPYWRIGLQKDWQGHYISLGHFGFRANVQPDPTLTVSDRYTDLGVDFNYQYLANPKHIYEFKASYIRESQDLLASAAAASAAQRNQQLGFLGLNGAYTFEQTYGLTVGYNHIHGNQDAVLYEVSPNRRPNSDYFTFELNYIPFGKTAGVAESYLNLRFAAQYVAYTRFDGGDKNYDGSGRNASDNNTLYFNTWLSF